MFNFVFYRYSQFLSFCVTSSSIKRKNLNKRANCWTGCFIPELNFVSCLSL